jgi:transmembrane sensor
MSNDDIQEFVIDCITDPDNRDKQVALDKWLQESEENRVLYAEIKGIWDIAETIPSAPFSSAEGWDLLSQHISENTPVKVRKMSGWWRAAAVLVPLCIVAAVWWQYSGRAHKEPEWVNFVAKGVDKDSVLLPDGSMVYAKPGTILAYNKQRVVKLEKGEAFFHVVQNEKKRFVVQMEKAAVTVLGTSFNITVDSVLTDVAVWDGKVSMTGSGGAIVLKEGEMGRLEKGSLNKMKGNYAYRCGWVNGYLVFENEEAGIVAAILSDYYHEKIIIPDSLVKKRITVRFRNLSFKEVQAVLAEVLDK